MQTHPPTPTPEQWFHERATHYVEAQVLFHLNQSGVLNLVDAEGPLTVREIAARLGLVPHVLSCCLDYVTNVDRLFEVDDEGRYGFTDFGRRVLARYSRDDIDRRNFNLFDVRVGSYGPVWSNLTDLLSGEQAYGEGVARTGEHAAIGVYKVAPNFLPTVERVLTEAGIGKVVEFGVPTGALARILAAHPQLQGVGIDKDAAALEDASRRAQELGVDRIDWVHGDFFEPDTWVDAARGDVPTAIGTIHFHELVADGGVRLQQTLRELATRLPGHYLFAIESSRLPAEARDEVPDTVWLYSHSNVLIHHLIENGRIFTKDRWVQVFADAGCRVVRVEPLNYLGYHLYLFQLPTTQEA